MAEGFARTYGADVLSVESAGLAPALVVAPLTRKVMLEKNVDLGKAYPKSIDMLEGDFDLVINMSGEPQPIETNAVIEDWDVRDPIGESEAVYRQVRDEIEQRVMRLVVGMRARHDTPAEVSPAPVDTSRRGFRQ